MDGADEAGTKSVAWIIADGVVLPKYTSVMLLFPITAVLLARTRAVEPIAMALLTCVVEPGPELYPMNTSLEPVTLALA